MFEFQSGTLQPCDAVQAFSCDQIDRYMFMNIFPTATICFPLLCLLAFLLLCFACYFACFASLFVSLRACLLRLLRGYRFTHLCHLCGSFEMPMALFFLRDCTSLNSIWSHLSLAGLARDARTFYSASPCRQECCFARSQAARLGGLGSRIYSDVKRNTDYQELCILFSRSQVAYTSYYTNRNSRP